MIRNYLLFLFFFLISQLAISQDNTIQKKNTEFNLNEYSSINLEVKEADEILPDEEKKKKKKRKKNVYFGIKTRKTFTKKGFGNGQVFELFNVLKTPYDSIDAYVQDIYWLDLEDRKIKKSRKIDPKYGRLLHGPYKKIKGEQVLEEGFFYYGRKHGRWMTWSKKDIVTAKQHFYKGWRKDSFVSFYDENKTKLKEVIPVSYGEMDGYYYHFFEDGKVAVKGKFDEDKRIGLWVEYYPNGKKRKRVIKYSKDPYSEEKPFIAKEWNEKGKVIYRSKKL